MQNDKTQSCAKSCGFPNGRNYKTVIISREKITVLLLVAPLFKKEKRCKFLNFKEIRGFFFSKK